MAVSFDGTTKRMVVAGVTKVDVQGDLYSAWKNWLILSDNAKYEQALRPVGGDSIGSGQRSPVYFFLMNDWKVVVDGIVVDFSLNLYCEEATNASTFPFVILNNGAVSYKVSDSPIVSSGSGLSAEQATQLETAATESKAARKMVKNDAVTSADSMTSTIFDDDGVTPYHVFNHPNPKGAAGAMSIYPDWIEIDIGTGVATVVDMLEVEMIDPVIEIELAAIIEIEIVDEAIEVEVI